MKLSMLGICYWYLSVAGKKTKLPIHYSKFNSLGVLNSTGYWLWYVADPIIFYNHEKKLKYYKVKSLMLNGWRNFKILKCIHTRSGLTTLKWTCDNTI